MHVCPFLLKFPLETHSLGYYVRDTLHMAISRNPGMLLEYVQCKTETLYSICYNIYVLLYDSETCFICTLTASCVAYHMT